MGVLVLGLPVSHPAQQVDGDRGPSCPSPCGYLELCPPGAAQGRGRPAWRGPRLLGSCPGLHPAPAGPWSSWRRLSPWDPWELGGSGWRGGALRQSARVRVLHWLSPCCGPGLTWGCPFYVNEGAPCLSTQPLLVLPSGNSFPGQIHPGVDVAQRPPHSVPSLCWDPSLRTRRLPGP